MKHAMREYPVAFTFFCFSALFLVLGTTFLFLRKHPNADEVGNGALEGRVVLDSAPTSTLKTPPKDTSVPAPRYEGTVLMSGISPFLEWNEADYIAASSSHAFILLYFYADWYPPCIKEMDEIKNALSLISLKNFVVFGVHFNDKSVTKKEQNLAHVFGVLYQNTKVLIRDGNILTKSPEAWNSDRYIRELSKRLL